MTPDALQFENLLHWDSRSRVIERYQQDNQWEMERVTDLGIPSSDFTLTLDAVYDASGI